MPTQTGETCNRCHKPIPPGEETETLYHHPDNTYEVCYLCVVCDTEIWQKALYGEEWIE